MAHITNSGAIPKQELGDGVVVQILTGDDSGCKSLRVGTATFRPDAGLPCHTHDFDESITILSGETTIFVDAGSPHRFINDHPTHPMVMIWVYAAASTARHLVDPVLCKPAD